MDSISSCQTLQNQINEWEMEVILASWESEVMLWKAIMFFVASYAYLFKEPWMCLIETNNLLNLQNNVTYTWTLFL